MGFRKKWGSESDAWSEGQGDEVPLRLTTFSYFRDYFLSKIITTLEEH